MASPIIVRPLASSSEREAYFQLGDQAFSPDPAPAHARYWEQFVTTLPEYRPEQVRGAFREGELLGGYILYERMLRVGAARLPTGCIGVVVTYPAYRHQGVATALMHDAIDYASSHHLGLLLLEGIAQFYHRYGYIDVFDWTVQYVDRAAILAQTPGIYSVRAATIDDAASILALYERHYGPYTGSFTRTLEQQTHRLHYRAPENPLLLAVDPADHVQGYLSMQHVENGEQAQEFCADTWLAALALLQRHARMFAGPEAPAALRYNIPPTSPLLQWMIDHLEVPDAARWRHPPEAWAVRSETYHHRNAAWMARLVDFPILVQAILPEWRARWQRSLAHWSGDVSLIVGEEACILHIDGTAIQLVNQPVSTADAIRLTPETFAQLVFGYRPVDQALLQEEQLVPSELLSVLNILFPADQAWIPSSDWF